MIKVRFLVLVMWANLGMLGCDSGDGDGGSDKGDGSAAHEDDDAGTISERDAGGAAGSCSGCAATQGCVQIDVSVMSDSADLPWKLWPDKTSGGGRLFAGVYAAGTPATVKYEDDVNLKTTTGRKSFEVCSAAGSVNAFCFLDDKSDGSLQNASETVKGSSDYIDTCSTQRQIAASVTVGARTSVACILSVSCD